MSDDNSQWVFQYYKLATGYGFGYTFDHSLPNAGLWGESELSAHWKQEYQFSDNLSLSTLLRYRRSNIDDDSFFIEGYLVNDGIEEPRQRLIDASYWESLNNSKLASAQLNWQINEVWTLQSGIELEFKDLQKAYNIEFGPSLPPAQVNINDYEFPVPPFEDSVAANRISTSEKNIYLLSKYQLPVSSGGATHDLHFGVRKDNHSRYGGETTLRGGFVSQWQRYTLKLLYGEAYQEPSARLLYGGWQGSGSDPRLKPRHANTWEINLNYQLKEWLFSTYYYQMRSRDLFNTTDTGAVNAGKANAEGGDFRVKYRPTTSMLANLTLWASATWLKTNDQVVNEQGQLTWQRNGDVAQDTLHFGGYFTFNDNWQVNLRGRHYGRRNTVATNSLPSVKPFHTLDLNLNYQPSSIPQIKYALDITNLTDRDYFHPGVRSASASVSNPGGINSDGVWIGSESFYSAQIPQPGREFRLSVYWQF